MDKELLQFKFDAEPTDNLYVVCHTCMHVLYTATGNSIQTAVARDRANNHAQFFRSPHHVEIVEGKKSTLNLNDPEKDHYVPIISVNLRLQ